MTGLMKMMSDNMTRTQKYEPVFSRKMRREIMTPGFTVVEFGRNLTKQAYYEKCYYECEKWEIDTDYTQEDIEIMDGDAMELEWMRMQDKAEQETE